MLKGIAEKKYIPDAVIAQAYEGICPQLKGFIKKNLSLLDAFYNYTRPVLAQKNTVSGESFRITTEKSPVSACVVVYEKSQTAIPELLAAVFPAVLAGVENIYSVALEEDGKQNLLPVYFKNAASSIMAEDNVFDDHSLNILAALELAGVENLLSIKKADLGRVANCFSKTFSSLAVLAFGGEELYRDVSLSFPHSQLWQRKPSEITMHKSLGSKSRQALKALHFNGKFVSAPRSYFAVVFNNANEQGWEEMENGIILNFDSNNLGAWLWPDLDREFFLSKKIKVNSVNSAEL